MLLTVRKRPGERLDYLLDFSEWLPEGDALVGFVIARNDGVVIEDTTLTDTGVRMWIYGGEPDTNYHVEVQVTTQQNRRKSQCFAVCNRQGGYDPLLTDLITAVSRWWTCANYTVPGDLA